LAGFRLPTRADVTTYARPRKRINQIFPAAPLPPAGGRYRPGAKSRFRRPASGEVRTAVDDVVIDHIGTSSNLLRRQPRRPTVPKVGVTVKQGTGLMEESDGARQEAGATAGASAIPALRPSSTPPSRVIGLLLTLRRSPDCIRVLGAAGAMNHVMSAGAHYRAVVGGSGSVGRRSSSAKAGGASWCAGIVFLSSPTVPKKTPRFFFCNPLHPQTKKRALTKKRSPYPLRDSLRCESGP
jgi:hypothetical protein